MSDVDYERLFKKFEKVVDTRDSQKIDKVLYHHLYQHAGFIAHYDIHGYRETYAGEGFLAFIDHFAQYPYLGYGSHGEFNRRLREYVLEHAEDIRGDFARKADQKELALLNALAAKHGVTVHPHGADVPTFREPDLVSSISKSGQFEFAF
ncbi:hypothetical protein GZH47_32335 (plasmid) [Paenibacillus rhizovicinus]|uniref:Uncharacterized protein n=1 Tax=Paenibacillus rhizovicinus TaxID=2704463 RepID=A0A6C0PB37_9BACL|nr:hypothetical protein [Paenibacillus rhizovicinus]QHW35575.1 hypothetical protein GZH47_32335 [Paenibacillus rhizovicinus]